MDGSEDFKISDHGGDSNNNGTDSSTGSDSEWHKDVNEVLTDGTI
jgi:hypothetical protein